MEPHGGRRCDVPTGGADGRQHCHQSPSHSMCVSVDYAVCVWGGGGGGGGGGGV